MLRVIDPISMAAPKTKGLVALLDKLSLAGARTLILTDGSKPELYLSARNAVGISVLPFSDATAYEILHAEAVVIESSALGGEVEDQPAPKARKTRTPKESA